MRDKKISTSKHWQSPDEKKWIEVHADGKLLGILEEGGAFEHEKARLTGLFGITIKDATPEALAKYGAKTVLPKRITNKMRRLAEKAEKEDRAVL